MKSIIVAYDKNYGIGANNELLWGRNLQGDLEHFKETTLGCPVIMGFNTYLSLKGPLPGRRNIVICREGTECAAGVEAVKTLQKAFDATDEELRTFVIGGGKVYEQAIKLVDEIIATEVDAIFDNATVFFPQVNSNIWKEVSRTRCAADDKNLYGYDLVTYRRRLAN